MKGHKYGRKVCGDWTIFNIILDSFRLQFDDTNIRPSISITLKTENKKGAKT